jgi:hypothetical protein
MGLESIEVVDLINEVISKINEDRETARQFLDSLSSEMAEKEDHAIFGDVANKYMKSLHKTTDQMTKLIELVLKYREEEEEFSLEKLQDLVKKTPSKDYNDDEEYL